MRSIVYIPVEEVNRALYRPMTDMDYITEASAFSLILEEDRVNKVQYWVRTVLTDLGPGKGYIYVLENAGHPGILKIGFTTRTPQERVKEINASPGVIIPWYIRNAFQCKSPDIMEKMIHEKLRYFRVCKEGFGVSLENAERIILEVLQEQNTKI